MFGLSEYYVKYCKELTKEEAEEVFRNGTGIISSGAYTFHSDGNDHCHYHAFGTFPGCLRGGSSDYDLLNIEKWYLLTPIDLICTIGYRRPQGVFFIPENFQTMEGAIDLDKLDAVYAELMDGVDDREPWKNAAVWRRYFNRQVPFDLRVEE